MHDTIEQQVGNHARRIYFDKERITFYLIGQEGAVQAVILHNWHILPNDRHQPLDEARTMLLRPIGADLGYHSPTPKYEGQSKMPCHLLQGHDHCHYDGSALAGEDMLNILKEHGMDALWEELEDYYQATFHTNHEGTP